MFNRACSYLVGTCVLHLLDVLKSHTAALVDTLDHLVRNVQTFKVRPMKES